MDDAGMVAADALFGKGVSENLVYHYTSRETALEKILPTGQIKLNVLEKTNDPREYLNWGITGIGGSDDMEPFFQSWVLVNGRRKKNTKVLCMTVDDLKPQRVGLMRRGFARSRMWAQYGEGHRGLCLIFDKSSLEAELRKMAIDEDSCYFGLVQYSDQDFRIQLDFNSMGETDAAVKRGVDSFIRGNVARLFFTKLTDWRDEMEYRAMIYDERNSPVFADIRTCLKGIVVGPEFPEADQAKVWEFGRQYQCKVGKLQWRDGQPGYVYEWGWESE